MKKVISILILTVIFISAYAQSDFLSQQKRYGRVRTAIKEKERVVSNDLKKLDISLNELNIMILAYKSEDLLEIYAKKKSEQKYQKLTSYEICTKSGKLGPKRMQGDRQVPEGFYYIDRFNPASNFYLSLGINYPNLSDKIKSSASHLGGDIFIHGNCVSIGCLPMTDDKIKEIYLYAIHARNNGQKKIPVYVFPFRMTDQNANKYFQKYEDERTDFWKNLKSGYDKFMREKHKLHITIDNKGNYIFK